MSVPDPMGGNPDDEGDEEENTDDEEIDEEVPGEHTTHNDNFNSVKLDKNKNLIIGAGDSVKILSQKGEFANSYRTERGRIENYRGSIF